MKEIPLTNYQLLSYFVPGFVVVLSFFVCNEPISDWASLTKSLKDISIAITASSVICAFIIGLILDGLRNGFMECIFDRMENKLPHNKKINWDFFYKGGKEAVALFYARYFTYYCFDINMVLSLSASIILLDSYSQLPHKLLFSSIVCISIIILFRDGWSLRKDMAGATNYTYP